MFFAGARDHIVQASRLHIFFELYVPERVEMFAKFLRQLPRLLWGQFADRFTNLRHAHTAILQRQRNADKENMI